MVVTSSHSGSGDELLMAETEPLSVVHDRDHRGSENGVWIDILVDIKMHGMAQLLTIPEQDSWL
ncbi:hypothetical protein TanjilG_24389 [Lupinus angustifolius]|uniref:Uncharacterized protein n=1 Tax=Lupinus angustifolius TaxID=3871 RepID=A0A1J7GGP3_LUPAN|nr:hypothetical protein TanjilG_24389 [Lupinus angustifolius]